MKTAMTLLSTISIFLLACNNDSAKTKTTSDSISYPDAQNGPVYSPSPKSDTASYEKMVNKLNDSTP